MPEVAVGKKSTEPQSTGHLTETSHAGTPFGRYFNRSPFGMSPFVFNPSPLSMMREFANDMDRFVRGDGTGIDSEAWAPVVDIQQCNGNLMVSAELPGVKKEEVKVEVAGDTLVLKGERRQEHKEDHDGYHRWERSYGRFYRAIPLPETAKSDQVKAELRDGVLKVSIPVQQSAKATRQIPIAG